MVIRLILIKILCSFIIEELSFGLGMPVETEVVLGIETNTGLICTIVKLLTRQGIGLIQLQLVRKLRI